MAREAQDRPGLTTLLHEPEKSGTGAGESVSSTCDSYLEYYDWKKDRKDLDARRGRQCREMTRTYYDLVTDFFEYGWGESFHFAPLRQGELREVSMFKHECRLAFKLGLNQHHTVLDMGCGVGGPARNIATLSGARIVGLNYNEYQIGRCRHLTAKAGLDHLCSFVKGDFCDAPFTDGMFDAAYEIEATCHASDRKLPFREAFRLLKPGGLFGLYEWIMTDRYDVNNKLHVKIKEDIMEGDSLPDITGKQDILDSLRAVGFEVVEEEDLAESSQLPWWMSLAPSWSLSNIKTTPLGRWGTHLMLVAMETIGMAPRGSVKVHRMLCKGADGCYRGGKEGIFSPLYFVLAKKPE